MQAFNSIPGVAESFESKQIGDLASKLSILSASFLMSESEVPYNSSANCKNQLSNGLEFLSSGGTSGHGSAALTPSPRPSGGSDDLEVNSSTSMNNTNEFLIKNNDFNSNSESINQHNLLLAQQLAMAGFSSNNPGLPHNMQLQLSLQAALVAGGLPISNGISSNLNCNDEALLDFNMGLMGNELQNDMLNYNSNNDKLFDNFSSNNCFGSKTKDEEFKQNMFNNLNNLAALQTSRAWATQPEDLFMSFNNTANSKRAIMGQNNYVQSPSGHQMSGLCGGLKSNSYSLQQQISSKVSPKWNNSTGKNLSNQSHSGSNNTGHMNPWSQALQYQRLGLGHTPMHAFPNVSKGANADNSSSNGCSGVFLGNNRNNFQDNKRSSQGSSFSSMYSHHNNKQNFNSSFKSDPDILDWHSLGCMLPMSCSGDMIGSNSKPQSSLDNMSCLENPLLEIMKNGSANGMGDLLDENRLSALDSSLAQTHNLPPNFFGIGNEERYSRKVFVGGLPPDIDEDEITTAFRRFGNLVVDWPHKQESKSFFPPKGYCFLLFQDEISVQSLMDVCIMDDDKFYWCVSSPTMKDKPVQIRPWNLNDSDYVHDSSQPLDPRKTIFVGGVPRPLRAVELAMIMDRLYGGVCYAGIDTDPELKYPKGAGRVAFSNQQSYIAAISARFVQLQHGGDIDKRVEVKPYVLDDQMCDECNGSRCAGKFAPFFCANVTCLQYYCEQCWANIHSRSGREYHKPLVKEGADRPRTVPFRW